MRARPATRWAIGATAVLLCLGASAAEDPYLAYVKNAPEFKPVRHDPKMLIGRWDTWIYMPWRYQWHIGTGDPGGQFCRDYGFNGGFTDHGDTRPLAWFQKWNLRFYNDHTAGKGYLYLHRTNWKRAQTDPRAIRFGARGPRPLDHKMLQFLKDVVTKRVSGLKKSPMRVAYALDDEVSWCSFVRPIPWRIHEDDADYERWLARYYGGNAPKAQFVTAEFTRAQLGKAMKEIDFSPFLDRMTYNDSYWAVFVGQLVESANAADPDTPCGFVGGQSPNLFGGYDYAKLMKRIQFLESYNIGSATEIIRSFNPQNAMPIVTTHFHNDKRGTANDIWQTWFYLAHGNRGMIGWVQGWFDKDKKPRPWLDEYKATNKEVGGVQGPKMVGARWLHDGVALYYSHPSIQVSWCLDIEPHGRTWVNRNGDCRLGTSHLVRKAWEYLLTDSGLQYNFLPYDEVIVDGVPREYRVVILPACYALSDIEAQRFRQFVERGGTLIADFACGLFDQHGKGRTKGAIDYLFSAAFLDAEGKAAPLVQSGVYADPRESPHGRFAPGDLPGKRRGSSSRPFDVVHDGTETKADFFGGKLWVETDQDKGFSYKTYRQLFDTVACHLRDGYAIAERRLNLHLTRELGKGKVVYLNLSPQRYLQYREEGKATDAHRNVFIKHVLAAGVKPWVTVAGPDGKRPYNCEVTCWRKGGRTLCFVLQNAAVTGSAYGGGGVEGLIKKKQKITVSFPAPVRDLIDERTGKKHGTTKSATFDFNPVEAVFFSFAGRPPR